MLLYPTTLPVTSATIAFQCISLEHIFLHEIYTFLISCILQRLVKVLASLPVVSQLMASGYGRLKTWARNRRTRSVGCKRETFVVVAMLIAMNVNRTSYTRIHVFLCWRCLVNIVELNSTEGHESFNWPSGYALIRPSLYIGLFDIWCQSCGLIEIHRIISVNTNQFPHVS